MTLFQFQFNVCQVLHLIRTLKMHSLFKQNVRSIIIVILSWRNCWKVKFGSVWNCKVNYDVSNSDWNMKMKRVIIWVYFQMPVGHVKLCHLTLPFIVCSTKQILFLHFCCSLLAFWLTLNGAAKLVSAKRLFIEPKLIIVQNFFFSTILSTDVINIKLN